MRRGITAAQTVEGPLEFDAVLSFADANPKFQSPVVLA